MPSKFRVKSDMMREMEVIEPQLFQPPDEEQKGSDDEQPKLTRAEMIARSKELRALRMKESQRSAKAHHQNKIKSKKYHRILKKEKMRQQIKEFEALQKTDPEAALRKIEQLDRGRVEERANLRHRNTGTWAKNLQVRAKYDKDVRQELAEQITISRELTAKEQVESSDDEPDDGAGNGDDRDPFNPWLAGKGAASGSGNEVEEFLGEYRKYWIDRNDNDARLKEHLKQESEPAESSPSSAATAATKGVKSGRANAAKRRQPKKESGWIVEDLDPTEPAKKQKKSVEKETKRNLKSMDNIDDMFDDAEEELRGKFANKLEKVRSIQSRNKAKKLQTNGAPGGTADDDAMDLGFKQRNQRPKLDEELITGDAADPVGNGDLKSNIEALLQSKTSAKANGTTAEADAENINPDDFAKVRTQHLKTALPATIYSEEGDFVELDEENVEYHFDEEKKLDIAQAFEDDDIVAEFQRDKDVEAKKNEPEEVDLSLPGWGSWGGVGIKKSKKSSKHRLIFKTPAAEKRKPENQGNVIIIENRDAKLQKHLVASLPFPFTKVADYEQSIRAPIGKDFVPATAHRLLARPALITKTGAIIEPMSENLLVKKPGAPRTKTARLIAAMNDDEL